MAILAALGVGVTASSASAQVSQPNIIFILLDDAGYADFGATGSGFIQTPNIDALANEGVTLTQYYASAPLCSPSRTSLMTGEYPAKMWMRHNTFSSIQPATPTLPQILGAEGYTSAHVGKWHIGANDDNDYNPLVAGFDHDVRFDSPLAGSPSYFDPKITIDNSEVVDHTGGHLTEVLTDYAIDFVNDTAASGPFYLQLWHKAPHIPLEPPLDWAALYPDNDSGKVAAMISDVDEQVGRLFDTLDTLGIADDTIVFITSDNGGAKGSHVDDPNDGPSNAPFRGHKLDVYEGGIRVPLFARWPNGAIVPASTNNSVTIGIDLIHTFAELAGADTSTLGLPGKSLLGALFGDDLPRTERLFWEKKAKGNFFVAIDGVVDDFAVRSGDWKLLREKDEVKLYNLVDDPAETTDQSAAKPGLVDALLAANQRWRLDSGRVRHTIEVVAGDVDVVGQTWTFNGGRLELEKDLHYDTRRLDFSFLARITPSAPPPSEWQLVAKRNKSWELILLPGGRLKLTVFDLSGSKTVLATPITYGEAHEVAFTFLGWPNGGMSVRLYVDGALVAETFELQEVDRADTPIRLGNNGAFTRPFIGVIEDLHIFSATLRPNEIDDLFGSP